LPAKSVAMWILVCAGFALAGYRASKYLRPLLAAPAAARWDRPFERLTGVLTDLGFHRRLLKIHYSGVLHALIFSGFIVLLSAIVQSFGSGLFPGFSLAPIGGNTWIAFLQDLFGLFILCGIGLAVYQRLVVKPKRFAGSNARDAWIIYGLVVAVVASMYLEFSLRLAADGTFSPWRPLSSVLATAFRGFGVGSVEAGGGSEIAYWLHVASVLAFLIYIPGSKHRHIFIAAPNIFFRNLKPKGVLPTPSAEQATTGIAEIDQFNWKHKLDLLSCTECGRCQAVCPAHASGLPLSPKTLIMDLRDRMVDSTSDAPLIGNVITEETLWSCTTCRACMDACPVHIEQMTKIVEMRRSVLEAGVIEPMLQTALGNLQQSGNSFGKPARQRARWTKDLGFTIKDARKEPVDILWFVGDFASYDPRGQKMTAHVARLLHAAGVDFGILYDAERNSGNDVRRVGDEGMFETLARHNIDTLSNCTFNRIMTTDPHTLNALRQEYRALGAAFDVFHYTQIFRELLTQKRLEIAVGEGMQVTYHDPCYLGRYNGEFDAPREIIRLTGHALREMARCRENSFCCGAGGGRIWMDDSAMKERPSENRIKEALALGDAQLFIVACPKDLVMYSAAVQNLGVEDKIEVRDIVELIEPICESMPKKPRRRAQSA
jgi:Fe-S oxidoreductase